MRLHPVMSASGYVNIRVSLAHNTINGLGRH